MAELPSKQDYIKARLTIERVHAERDWLALGRKPANAAQAALDPDPNEQIEHKQAAKLIGISSPYLRKLEQRGRIARVKRPGRTVYYRRKDVERLKRDLDR